MNIHHEDKVLDPQWAAERAEECTYMSDSNNMQLKQEITVVPQVRAYYLKGWEL